MGKPKITKTDIQKCDCKATCKSVSVCVPASIAEVCSPMLTDADGY